MTRKEMIIEGVIGALFNDIVKGRVSSPEITYECILPTTSDIYGLNGYLVESVCNKLYFNDYNKRASAAIDVDYKTPYSSVIKGRFRVCIPYGSDGLDFSGSAIECELYEMKFVNGMKKKFNTWLECDKDTIMGLIERYYTKFHR